jgi:serine-type D-Ala-D-Ala carboxypeptidase/endopeptidase (penicillin-binding protein 4)
MPRADGPGRPRAVTRRQWLVALVAAFAVVLSACSADEPRAAPEPPAADTPGPAPADAGDAPEEPSATLEPASPSPPVEPDTPVPSTRPDLTARLERVVAEATTADPELTLAVLVVDEAGREVVAHEADRALLPASTLKQVTAAAALTTLGPQAQLRTTVDATGGIDETGRLDGDLVVIGSGDPTLVTDEYARFIYPARPSTPLASLADQLVEAGLTHLHGHIRGTAPRFAAASLPTGWRDAYLSALDGRYGAGLTVDGGLRTIVELPEVPEEDDADEEAGEEVAEADEPEPDGRRLSIFEQLAALGTDLPPVVKVDLATDPALHTAAELRRLLEERGVRVDGVAMVEPAETPIVARLASVLSPPLDEVLRFTVQRSDNHLADALALAVARTRTGEGSWDAADRAFGQVLARFGVPGDGARFADGSGLSRDDRVTARLLVELDRRLTADRRFGGTWRSLQAVAGSSGTLDRRLVGTPAEGRLLAKTGTLRDVAALSGQVIARDADPVGAARPRERGYHVAVLGNEATGLGRGVVRALVDEVVLALVADLDGCRVVPLGDDDGPLGHPPSQVRCAAD